MTQAVMAIASLLVPVMLICAAHLYGKNYDRKKKGTFYKGRNSQMLQKKPASWRV